MAGRGENKQDPEQHCHELWESFGGAFPLSQRALQAAGTEPGGVRGAAVDTEG